jgi:peptidoglycan/LPS O-acetylase OafA/YrhL
MAASCTPAGRLGHLDGLRGLAITAVVLYHAYDRWADLFSSSPGDATLPLAGYGWLGVYLFFLISGFVILMTLETCDGFADFAFKRWIRLFPAMLIVSCIVYASAPLFPLRPLGEPQLRDVVPGLLFIEPAWLEIASGSEQHMLEGSFWSLFVEVKFYLLSAVAYYSMGLTKTLFLLTILFLGWYASEHFQHSVLTAFFKATGAKYFGWFVAGALFYVYTKTAKRKHYVTAVIFACAVAFLSISSSSLKASMCVVALFALAIVSPRLQRALANRMLVFLGTISYALYLVHENMMVSMALQLKSWMPVISAKALPVPGMLAVVVLAYFITRYIEAPMRRALTSSARRRTQKESEGLKDNGHAAP